MIVRQASELENSSRHAKGPGWESIRLIVKSDGVGYSVHETVVREGTELILEYKSHYESNYCLAGEGEVVDVATGVIHVIGPGVIYTLDQHDKHILRALKGDLRLLCVFNPPLKGDETHQADGSYRIEEE